jgi:sulfatase maturation enzyme AslB (radical SAM superfamily)
MTNKNIFCSAPWTNLHVYWDGMYGICCSERERSNFKHSIKNTSITDWYKSDVLQQARTKFLQDQEISLCQGCRYSENLGHESRRIRENFKTLIFTEKSFQKSFLQSPWLSRFQGQTPVSNPVDWHIDLGNECNLACKMCHVGASSKMAAILKKHGKFTGDIRNNWTDHPQAWKNLLSGIDAADVKRIHVMGGEPTIMKKYQELLDHMITTGKTHISLSLVTNGTNITDKFLDKLALFDEVDIEISIETVDESNDYIRAGSHITRILKNIDKVKNHSAGFTVVLRTVPQLLSIDRYHLMIEYALDNDFIIESIPLEWPDFMSISVLPAHMRSQLLNNYQGIKQRLQQQIISNRLYTGRNPATIAEKLLREVLAMENMLSVPDTDPMLRGQLAQHLNFWDREFKMDFRHYYPAWAGMMEDWGYGN